MALQRVPINNFRGGLNTRDSPFELQPNESPDLLNVTITDLVGALQVRKGMTRFDQNCPGRVDNAKLILLNGQSPILMASIGGDIWSMDNLGTFTKRYSHVVGSVWDFAQMPDASGNDMVWCCNGFDTPQKWDGVAGSTSVWAGSPYTNTWRILVWKNKMVMLAPQAANFTASRVLFSKPGDPEQTTGAFDFVDLRGDDDDIEYVTEMNVLADRLYVFKRSSIWMISDPSTLVNRRVGEPGCYDRFQSDVCNNKLYFFNEQGIWSTAGVAVAYESGSINSFFSTRFNSFYISGVRLLATRDTYPRLLVTLPIDAVTTNNAVIEVVPNINFRRIGGRRYLLLPAFLLHTMDVASLCNFKASPTDPWGVFGGRISVTQFHQLFKGTTDAGTKIAAHWQSSWMAIQGEEPFERVRRLNVELSGDCQVDVFKDFSGVSDFSAQLPGASGGNFLQDGNFESYTNGQIVNTWGGSLVTASNLWASSGVMSATAAGFIGSSSSRMASPTVKGQGNSLFFEVQPNSLYTLVTDYNIITKVTGGKGRMALLWSTDLNVFISQNNADTAVDATGVGSLVLTNIAPPPGATRCDIQVGYVTGGTSGTPVMLFDNVQLLNSSTYRFVRLRPESRGRFHAVRFSTPVNYTTPFLINVAELVVRGGKEH